MAGGALCPHRWRANGGAFMMTRQSLSYMATSDSTWPRRILLDCDTTVATSGAGSATSSPSPDSLAAPAYVRSVTPSDEVTRSLRACTDQDAILVGSRDAASRTL